MRYEGGACPGDNDEVTVLAWLGGKGLGSLVKDVVLVGGDAIWRLQV